MTADSRDTSKLEAQRLQFTRTSDADGFTSIVTPDMIYVHESGRLYKGAEYVAAIRSHELSYNHDVSFDEDTRREAGDTFMVSAAWRACAPKRRSAGLSYQASRGLASHRRGLEAAALPKTPITAHPDACRTAGANRWTLTKRGTYVL